MQHTLRNGIAFFYLLTLSTNAIALEARWLGVAGIVLSDGTSTLIFDPVFTKPTLLNWIFNSKMRSNETRVQTGLIRAKIKTAQAVFSSHGHFDHAIDLALVSFKTGATIFGGESLKTITTADPHLPVRFSEIKDQQPIEVGLFKVTPIRRTHAPILQNLDWRFLPGPVPKNFQYDFYDYREGEVWAYWVEHPNGNILIDQGSHFFKNHTKYAGKADAYFVGVANKSSLDDIVENNIKIIRAPLVIPIHFDVFFLQSEWIESQRMPGSELEALEKRVNSQALPPVEFLIPKLYEPISIRRTLSVSKVNQ